MLVFSIVRIAFIDAGTFAGFMISVYWVLFGIMFIMVEFNLKKSRMWFYFLNGSLGKGLFHVFLFLTCFGSGGEQVWVDVFLAIIFAFTAPIFFLMTCFFKDLEGPYIDHLVEKVRLEQPSAPPVAPKKADIPAKPTTPANKA